MIKRATNEEVLEYKTLHSATPEQLDSKVMARVEDGWQPYGHPNVVHNGRATAYIQVVVKYK